jgi:hypothetical protein
VKHLVAIKDLLQIIFEDLDPVWVKFMWDADGSVRGELLKIVFMLYLVKCRDSYS